MSARNNVLVTGATGFLGSHLAYRLLEEGHRVSVLARGSKSTSARARVLDALEKVAGSDNGFRERLAQVEILEGDISQSDLGLSPDSVHAQTAKIDEVWHCAASLSFTHEDRDEIFRMNVGGTENVLKFVGRTRKKRLQHVSTAYVAGARDIAYESEMNVGQTFRNAYEESKCRAEHLIADAHARGDVAASVYRPSIVIGDSKSGRVTHFHGVYAFIRALFSAVERLRKRLPEQGVIHLPFRVPGGETTTLNFVPIDYVVDGMVEIGSRETSLGGTYHLTNPYPTENNVWLPNICRLLGVDGIRLVSESSFLRQPITKLEGLFQKQMAFYYMYLKGEPRFSCERTIEALKNTGIECPRVTVQFIERMVGWYIDFLRRGGDK